MRTFLIALLPFVAAAQLPTIPFSPQPADTLESRVAWLTQHTSTLDDLQPLKQSIGDAGIVVFYSPSAKVPLETQLRITRFLHEEMGFDIFATHASAFQANEFDQALDAGKPVRGALPSGGTRLGHPVLAGSAVPKDVVEYLQATHGTAHPLHTAGLRTFVTAEQFSKFCDRLFALIDHVDSSIATPAERKIIANIFRLQQRPLELSTSRRDSEETVDRARDQTFLISDTALKVGTGLERIAHSTSPLSREALAYSRLLKDVSNMVDIRSRGPSPLTGPSLPVWVDEELQMKRKIIVWDGDPGIEARFNGVSMVAEFDKLPEDSTYILAIAAIQRPGKSRLESKDEFDALLYQTGKSSLFLSLRNLEPTHWLHERLSNRWTDAGVVASPLTLFDGLIGIVRSSK